MAVDANQLAQTLVSRGGYNQTDAMNAAQGPRAAELAQEFGVGQQQPSTQVSYGAPGGGLSTGNYGNDVIKNAQALQQFNVQANQPAIQQLQNYIPQVQQGFETQKNYLQSQVQPLQQRYQNLIDTLKGQQTQDINRTTVAQSNILGQRGILPSSGLGETTISQALSPINQVYTPQIANAGIQGQQDIAALLNQINLIPSQQAAAIQPIQAQLAGLQTGAPETALSTALGLLGAQNQRFLGTFQQPSLTALQQAEAQAYGRYSPEANPYLTSSNQISSPIQTAPAPSYFTPVK